VKRFITMVATAAAALAVMAAMTAVPASAGTVLCKVPATNCTPENVQPAGSYFTTGYPYAGGFVIEEAGGENGAYLSCDSNAMSAKTEMKNGNPLPGEFNGMLSKCHPWANPEATCGSSSMNHPPVTFEAGVYGEGTVRIGSSSQPLTVSAKCNLAGLGEISCTYTAKNTVVMSFNSYVATVSNASMTSSGGLCGWSNPVLNVAGNQPNKGEEFISSATESVLCKKDREEANPCSNVDILPAGSGLGVRMDKLTIVDSEGVEVFGCGTYKKAAPVGLIAFGTTTEAGSPLPAATDNHLNAGQCMLQDGWVGCQSGELTEPSSSLQSTGVKSSTATIGSAGSPLAVSFSCNNALIGTYACTYAASEGVSTTITNLSGEAAATGVPVKRTAGTGGGLLAYLCPSSAVLNIIGATDPSGYSINVV
jgi:hypothetical protein